LERPDLLFAEERALPFTEKQMLERGDGEELIFGEYCPDLGVRPTR
jgi:hypothetical protein